MIDTKTTTAFAGLGATSGVAATGIIELLDGQPSLWIGERLLLAPISLVPGLVFGVVIGIALFRRQRLTPATLAAYVVAATLSYFAAFTLALNIDPRGVQPLIDGPIAGLMGGALLAGLGAALMPSARGRRGLSAMAGAGCVLGVLLWVAFTGDSFWSWALFFGLWQMGYAAALAQTFDRPVS